APLLARPLSVPFGALATGLLPAGAPAAGGTVAPVPPPSSPAPPDPRALQIHALASGGLFLFLVLIWALTSRGYFWPIWVALPLGLALAIHAWVVATDQHPGLVARFRGSHALALLCGIAVAVSLFFIAIWAVSSRGYFWP